MGVLALLGTHAAAQLPVLKRSDVVFMYQAPRATYADYGATVVAWGGRPTAKSLAEAKGLKFFGSVGMVTEFARFYDRFPDTYEQALGRDLEGRPFKVPWLTDHQHKGVPYWWCCTRQPLFRQYLSERVTDTVKAGATGVHIDDHLGTAASLGSGGCFCDRCVNGFRDHLAALPQDELARHRIADPDAFNVREVFRTWLAAQAGRKVSQHPLYSLFRVCQFRGAARFMEELRALAARTAGRPVPMSANACLLWGPHLSDYRALDFFSAEIEHHAPRKQFEDGPLVAYRLADAVGRPLASTASGGDWAFIKEHNLPGLVQGWIALGQAAGHGLMAPHRQWCYTPQKGTHWYEGPKEKFAPLYRFVREHPALFDDYQNHADLTVAFSQRTFDRNAGLVMRTCNRLAAAPLSYRIAFGGDAIVDHPLPADLVRGSRRLLVLEAQDFSSADQRVLEAVKPEQRLADVEQALRTVPAAVRVESPAPLRVLPRVKPGAAVVHVLNRDYDPARDTVRPAQNVGLRLDLAALGVPGAGSARVFAPGAAVRELPLEQGGATLPEVGLWTVVEVREK